MVEALRRLRAGDWTLAPSAVRFLLGVLFIATLLLRMDVEGGDGRGERWERKRR